MLKFTAQLRLDCTSGEKVAWEKLDVFTSEKVNLFCTKDGASTIVRNR